MKGPNFLSNEMVFPDSFFLKIFFSFLLYEFYSRIPIPVLILILKQISWKNFAIVSCFKRKILNPKTAIQNLNSKNQN